MNTVPAPADTPRPSAALTGFRLGIEAGLHLAAARARLDALLPRAIEAARADEAGAA